MSRLCAIMHRWTVWKETTAPIMHNSTKIYCHIKLPKLLLLTACVECRHIVARQPFNAKCILKILHFAHSRAAHTHRYRLYAAWRQTREAHTFGIAPVFYLYIVIVCRHESIIRIVVGTRRDMPRRTLAIRLMIIINNWFAVWGSLAAD